MTSQAIRALDEKVKQARTRLLESDLASRLLGDSFHPGGLRLTEHLGMLLRLSSESRVLNVASGKCFSSILLAERFGCHVVDVDTTSQDVRQHNHTPATDGLASRIRFDHADAKHLPFPDASFDAVICECAFCTFPDKFNATRELARVLRTGGRLGFSEFTRGEMLARELDCLFALIACIAEAQPIAQYVEYLRRANFDLEKVEFHDAALTELTYQIRARILRPNNLAALKKLSLPGVDSASYKEMAKGVLSAIQQGQLGYVILVGVKLSVRSSNRSVYNSPKTLKLAEKRK